MSLVSAIVTTYDRPHYLRQALASVTAQTLDDVEIVVVDDSGPAENAAVIAEADDERIRYLRHDVNRGVGEAVAAGLAAASGEFGAVLNDDDLWHPEFLRLAVGALRATPEAVCAFSDHWIIDANGQVDEAASDACTQAWGRGELAGGLHRPFRDLVARKVLPMNVAAVFRLAEARDRYDARAGDHWDYALPYWLSCRGEGSLFLPQRLASYRVTAGQKSSVPSRRNALDHLWVVDLFLSDESFRSERRALRKLRAETLRRLALLDLADARRAQSLATFYRSLQSDVHPRALVGLALALSPGATTLARRRLAIPRPGTERPAS